MIAFLKGTLAGKTLTSAFVETGGIGYEVGMAHSSLAKLPEAGQPVCIFTYLHVREDALSLYGFLSQEEKDLFLQLLSVSGVGPKVALAALSYYEPAALAEAIGAEDVTRVAKIPGIGKKTAQRIILELKGSIHAPQCDLFQEQSAARQSVISGAQEALLAMGFTSAEAELALAGAPSDSAEGVLVQYALKRLGSGLAGA